MDNEIGEWVIYDPPKSVSFGHLSRIRNPRRAWPLVQRFLDDLTRYTLAERAELRCSLPSGRTDAGVARERIEEARHSFAHEIPSEAGFQTSPRWKISESEMASALQFAFDDDHFPPQEDGPTWFSFCHYFTWNEFNDPYKVVGETDTRKCFSRLAVIAGRRRLFLQPFFVYPGPSSSESVKDFVDRTEAIVPFRFRNQYFKRWLPPRSAKASYGRYLRLDANWRRGSSIH
jgi:hypothetical protein